MLLGVAAHLLPQDRVALLAVAEAAGSALLAVQRRQAAIHRSLALLHSLQRRRRGLQGGTELRSRASQTQSRHYRPRSSGSSSGSAETLTAGRTRMEDARTHLILPRRLGLHLGLQLLQCSAALGFALLSLLHLREAHSFMRRLPSCKDVGPAALPQRSAQDPAGARDAGSGLWPDLALQVVPVRLHGGTLSCHVVALSLQGASQRVRLAAMQRACIAQPSMRPKPSAPCAPRAPAAPPPVTSPTHGPPQGHGLGAPARAAPRRAGPGRPLRRLGSRAAWLPRAHAKQPQGTA
jgi:hypothetical protein